MDAEFTAPTLNFLVILPVTIMAGWAVALMFIDFLIPTDRKQWSGWLSLVGIVPALIYAWLQWNHPGAAFTPEGGHPMVVLDNYAVFLNIIYLLTALLAILLSVGYVHRARLERAEYFFLMLFSISGMMLMGMANDLILVFLALELLSIPLYIMSGFDRRQVESEESAMKYFLLGAFSSGFFLFGIALTYGATGSTALPEIVTRIGDSGALGLAGIAMLLVGFGFKVGAVPFHMWTPDVYEGAPTAVTAFMSVGAKVGGFAAMMRVFVEGLATMGEAWIPAVAIISAVTMIVGNVAAISQQNIKRMLAYSSIAHAGYILMGVAATTGADGVGSALFYMLAYLFTNLGVFAIVIAVEQHDGKRGLLLEDYKGLAARHPLLSLTLAYLMLSLIGIPTTSGFTAKFFVFRSAIDAELTWLVVVGALTSVVSAFYYIRPVYYAYMYEGPAEAQTSRALHLALGVTAIATLVLGFVPMPWFDAARAATLNGLQLLAGG